MARLASLSMVCESGNDAKYGPCVGSGYNTLLAIGMPNLVYPGIEFTVILIYLTAKFALSLSTFLPPPSSPFVSFSFHSAAVLLVILREMHSAFLSSCHH
mmetsp:Transcript_36821/g.97814  ORF Transcript_36821/g.97814 Transcript_36821/m.97814 type:complete len:100 (+) Transcript_36821:1395-1694(+)